MRCSSAILQGDGRDEHYNESGPALTIEVEKMAESEQNRDSESQDAPKIIVDDDWKAQAQAEKEKLAEQVEKQGESPAAGPAGEEGGRPELPPASFATLINSIMTQTIFALGGMEDPQTKRRYVDLDLAKHHIDTLSVLETKTRGNLSDEEKKLLDRALYETRMQYVQIAQRVSSMP